MRFSIKTKIKQSFCLSLVLTLFLTGFYFVTTVEAETTVNNTQYTLLEPLPCIPGGGVTCGTPGELMKTVDLRQYVAYVFNLLIALSAAVAVFETVWGGFQYMFSTDSFSTKSAGIARIKSSLLGLLMILSTYIILKTVNPKLVNIPSNLVPPIGDTLPQGASFRDQISQSVAAYRNEMETVTAKYNASNVVVTNYEKELVDLEKQRVESTSEEQVTLLDAKIADLKNKITDEKNSGSLIVAKALIDSKNYEHDPILGTTRFKFDDGAGQILGTYYTQKAKIEASGGSPANLKDLEKYKDYSVAVLKINQQIAKIHDITNPPETIAGATSKTAVNAVANSVPGVNIVSSVSGVDADQALRGMRLNSQKEASTKEVDSILSEYKEKLGSGTELNNKLVQKMIDAKKSINDAVIK